jgi:hypothetical protein
MIDVMKLAKEAADEMGDERAKEVKTQIKAKLREIARAERIVANLRLEFDAMIRELQAA